MLFMVTVQEMGKEEMVNGTYCLVKFIEFVTMEKENENGKKSERWIPNNTNWFEIIFSSIANVRSFHAFSEFEVKSNENA